MATAVQRERLKSLLSNKLWRLNNLYKILDETGQVVTLKLNEEQLHFAQNRHYFNCVLKARQLGFSTFIQIDGLDDCLFNSNTNFGIIAQSLDDAQAIFKQKIKFAYDNLPDWLKSAVTATTDRVNEITFSNGSTIRVGTSLRGGTLQRLHVSEFGKIAAKFPDKAKEIKTGALNTVHAGQLIDIESTAEGQGGEFHSLCVRAERLQQQNATLTTLDPKFHFYPWWKKKSYRLENHGVETSQRLKTYFEGLQANYGIALDDAQRAWYVKKEEQMGGPEDMRREFPSTHQEPFEVAVEGAYYAHQMARVRKEGRICRVPVEDGIAVNTFWDLGRNDNTAIWLHQRVAKEERFIGFYQNSGESLAHYVNWLNDWKPPDVPWGTHYLPHDAEVVDLSRTDNLSRERVIQDLGLQNTRIVPRIADLQTGIEATRNSFAPCWFDAEACAEGIICLDNYRKDWNETRGVWRNEPAPSIYNHGADAFRQFAQSREKIGAKRPSRTVQRAKVAVI